MLVKPAPLDHDQPVSAPAAEADWTFDELEPELQAALLRAEDEARRGAPTTPLSDFLERLRQRRAARTG